MIKQKIAIFKNFKKLNGVETSIPDDLSEDTLQERRLSWRPARTEKDEGANVRLVHNKVMIKDDVYTWDLQASTRARLVGKKQSSSRQRQ